MAYPYRILSSFISKLVLLVLFVLMALSMHGGLTFYADSWHGHLVVAPVWCLALSMVLFCIHDSMLIRAHRSQRA